MEVFYPFKLFILAMPDEPSGQAELSRHPVLYETEADCIAAGAAVIDARIRLEHENATVFRAFCQSFPDHSEFDTLFWQMEERRRAASDK